MVTELRVYFEGDARLRPGFHSFLGEIVDAARNQKWRLDLIATDGTPVQDFRDALKTHKNAWNILLLDSDMPLNGSRVDLCRSKSLEPSHEALVFWMVQIMESWFLADISALKNFYGNGLQEEVLKGNPNVEEIPKEDVLSRLKRATKSTKPGEYHKTKHAPALLERIDVSLVKAAAPDCERMFRIILGKLAD
jgi:Domain of unknown function (DUF4276)